MRTFNEITEPIIDSNTVLVGGGITAIISIFVMSLIWIVYKKKKGIEGRTNFDNILLVLTLFFGLVTLTGVGETRAREITYYPVTTITIGNKTYENVLFTESTIDQDAYISLRNEKTMLVPSGIEVPKAKDVTLDELNGKYKEKIIES